MNDLAISPVETTFDVPANPENKELLLETQSIVAQKLLSNSGWDVLGELFTITNEMITTTQLFVLPVIVKEKEIEELLGAEYEAFNTGFTALKEDLATMTGILLDLSKQHTGKTGGVAEADIDTVSAIALGYSKLQTQVEEQVGPEMIRQMGVLEENGISPDYLFAVVQELVEKAQKENVDVN